MKPRIIVRIYVPQPFIIMNILIDITILCICFFLLIIGSEWIMKGAVALARRLGVSELVIASTIIAFGTGLPTIAVNFFLITGNPNGSEIVIGNALGTNFVNIGLGLGIPALLLTIITKYEVFEKEIPIYLGISSLLTCFMLDSKITGVEGIILLFAYIFALYIIYQYSVRERLKDIDKKEVDIDTSTISTVTTEGLTNLKSIFYIIIGFLVLTLSSICLNKMTGKLVLDFNISEYILGLTVIGIGTSIPMIYTSIRSAKKGYTDIIVGNVFGSTIANIALGTGLPAVITPIILNQEALNDVYYFGILNMIVIFGLLIEMKLLGKNKALNWVSGLVIIVFYVIYLGSKFIH